jgi:lysophospholipase L1-like esterase
VSRRRAARRLAGALVVLLLGALVLEVILRLSEHGPAPLFVRENGRVRLAPWRETFVPLDVAEESGRLRIVCMGASTYVGVPYEPVLSPPRWLGLILQRRGVAAETITVAAPGLASHDLLGLLPEVLELHPDALVVATGHNEYLSVSRLLGERWWHELRVVLFLRNALGIEDSREMLPTGAHGFDHAAVTLAFRENIRAMQGLADAAGVPLLLCAEVSNLADFPPVLGHAPGAEEDADAAFERGRALLAAGDRAGALAALERARDLDLWPHRAHGGLNAALRAEARTCVALDRLFVEHSAAGVPGFDLFADHCHPNPEGQRLMALGVADALEDLKLFPLTGRRGLAPPLDEGLQLFGADEAMEARAGAQVGRALTGFALMRGEPGPLDAVARRMLETARGVSEGRAGEVFASLTLLDLLEGDRQSAREHYEACLRSSPTAIAGLQRLHDGYPWVAAVFQRNGLQLRRGNLLTLEP